MAPKNNIFISRNQDFVQKVNDAWLYLALVKPFLFFTLVSMAYSMIYHDEYTEGRARGIIGRTIDGLSNHMDVNDISLAVAGSIIATILLGYLVYYFTDVKKIIVELWFSDKERELKIVSVSNRGDMFVNVVRYEDICQTYSHMKDGISEDVYEVLIIGSKQNKFGAVYREHFTWSTEEYQQILERLKLATS
jgi:hypothetical protein